MHYIIDIKEMIKSLKKQGLTIDDPKRLEKYLHNCNFHTLINGYSEIFLNPLKPQRYLKESSSNQIIALYNFDNNFSNHLLRYLLKIEKKLNTLVAYALINVYQIEDKCLLKLNPDYLKKKVFKNLNTNGSGWTFEYLIGQLVKFLEVNGDTNKYEAKNVKSNQEKWREVPLDLMCLTWSFTTTFLVFSSIDELLADYIADKFNVTVRNTSGFIDFIHNCLYLRNMISHGFKIYDLKPKYQSSMINKLYYDLFNVNIKTLGLYELLKLIEFFAEVPNFIEKTLHHFNQVDIHPQFKKKVNLFGTYHEEN